jgi:type I restriction-modification system DNA methylase subunit
MANHAAWVDVFLDKFLFTDQLKRLDEAAILWRVFEQFAALDLRPQSVPTLAMGYLFEDLIRRFSEISNETAGEHFTPREVIRLIVDLLLVNDGQALTGKGIIRQVYDPACGTGAITAAACSTMRRENGVPGKAAGTAPSTTKYLPQSHARHMIDSFAPLAVWSVRWSSRHHSRVTPDEFDQGEKFAG